MAKITFGAFVTDIKGKVGSTVFQANKAGAFVRNKVVPANPQTTPQVRVRSDMSAISAAWRGLTEEQRLAWSAAAPNFPYQDRLGQTKTYSGQQLFVKLNLQLLSVNPSQSLVTTPPLAVELPGGTIDLDSVENQTTAMNIGIDVNVTGYVQADHWLEIEATPGLSPGVMRPALSKFRLVTVANPANLTALVNIGTAYTDVIGVQEVGSKISFQVSIVSKSTGQKAIVGRASKVVTAA